MTVADWQPAERPEAATTLVDAGFEARLASLLARRGVTDPQSATRFLEPSIGHLHPPQSLAGMAAAVTRLMAARGSGERVAVVGDYDVDGVTGTALLSAVLGACGIDNLPILPHRMRDGYGFQPVHSTRAHEAGCGLIVTVDCGTQSVAAAETALEAGIDVVVTDHHLPGETPLPDPVILINPHQAACSYPFDGLSGAGLAMKLALGVAEACGREIPVAQLMRLASLGTIADMVPLLDENRIIAALGLKALAKTRSRGLKALLEVAGIEPPFAASDVGFRIGPRLNAPGRLDSADMALDLLLCRSEAEARRLAESLDRMNRERQTTERLVVDTARAMVDRRDDLPPIVVLWNADWHRGVVGIAAGRLARELHRPTILLADEGETATGSGRSAAGIHLHDFIDRWHHDLERFGGHSQAIGLTARSDRLPALREAWEAAAEPWRERVASKRYTYELEVDVREADRRLLAALDQLEPHGEGNPKPMLRVRGPLHTLGTPRLFGNDHLSVRVTGERGGMLKAVGWGWAPKRERFEGSFEMLGFLEHDRYRGGVSMRLVDVRPSRHDSQPDQATN